MHRRPIHERQINPPFNQPTYVERSYPVLATVSGSYPNLKGRLPTCYSPVRRSNQRSKLLIFALDLHVLGTPPAFILPVSENYISDDYKYVVGRVSLGELHKVQDELRKRDVFIAAYPND